MEVSGTVPEGNEIDRRCMMQRKIISHVRYNRIDAMKANGNEQLTSSLSWLS